MNRLFLTATVSSILTVSVCAGDYTGKESKQVAPAPCPEWYKDNEWNVSLWGTYVVTNTDYARNLDLVDVVQSTTEGGAVLGEYDRYIGGDHAWGGGADIKYFFHRYFGIGVEGFVVNARKGGFDIFEDPDVPIFARERLSHHRAGATRRFARLPPGPTRAGASRRRQWRPRGHALPRRPSGARGSRIAARVTRDACR